MSKNAAGIEVFTGFGIKYPEYALVTPQTLQEYTIRSMTVQEEETLKASLLTPARLPDHLNSILFSCTVKKPDNIKTFDDFLNSTTVKDRDALMYALYHVTYKDIHLYDVTCSNCSNVNSVKINFLKSVSIVQWPNKDSILKKRVEVPLELAAGVTAIVRQPTLAQESTLLKTISFNDEATRDMNMDLLIIEKFKVDGQDPKNPDFIEDRDNILKGYKQLPATDRRLIDKAYADNFGEYHIDIKSKVICQKCQSEEEISIDLVRQFFRAVNFR
jgi:hypothetical protein